MNTMNEITIPHRDLSALCRLCLGSGVTVLDIFFFSTTLRNQVADVIMNYFPVRITRQDEMPKCICEACFSQLEKIHQFHTQIVQSEKTFRQYLQKSHDSDKQTEPECSNRSLPKDSLIHQTNPDITVKSESPDLQDAFDVGVSRKDKESTNFNSTNQINEEMPLQSKIKEEPIDEDAFTEYTNDTAKVSSNSDCNEVSCEDSKIDIGDTEIGENLFVTEKGPTNFDSANNLSEETPLKSKIKEEPIDDNSFTQIEHTNDSRIRECSEISCAEETVTRKENESTNLNLANNINKEMPSISDIKNEPDEIKTESFEDTTDTSSNDDQCDKQCTKLLDVDVHKDGRAYKCDACDKCFTVSSNLKRHKRVHTDERPYYCNACNRSFSDSSNLIRHKRMHTGKRPHRCDVCNKCFSSVYSLNSHKRLHADEKSYQCDVCSKTLSCSTSLNRHKRMHAGERPYQCDDCDKCFFSVNSLKNHKRVHTGEKPYRCEFCDKHFSEASNLKIHKRIHTGEKPYSCDVCEQRFSRTDRLKIHKHLHTGEKPFRCDVCSMGFTEPSNLKTHKRLHTGEKSYKCDVCVMVFSRSDSLGKHKRLHTGERPYKCDVCNKSFRQSCHLTKHKRTHTGDKP